MAFLWRFHEKSGLYLDFNRLEKGRFDEYVSGAGLSTLTVLDFLSHPSSCTLCTDLRRHGLSLELLSNQGTIILQSHYPGRACQTAAAGGHIDFEMLLMTRGCSFFLLMVKRARKNWATILGRSSFGLINFGLMASSLSSVLLKISHRVTGLKTLCVEVYDMAHRKWIFAIPTFRCTELPKYGSFVAECLVIP